MKSSGARPTAVLVDDNPAMLAAVNEILQDDCEILAAVNDGGKALEAINTYRPDIVILDIAMPGMNGLETAQHLKSAGLSVKIVFLTITEDIDYARAVRKIGASYVVKRRMGTDLVTAVREILTGRLFPLPVAPDEGTPHKLT